ncbi:uncharacterized protein BT62DRAFT_938096 [Guyanagaster necrorhizus]|uniref:Uncharacterized protein n=1 Tax=Guyanagaster necrorhizus TaxID=856835 RepID=A0A9P8AKZ4_9AGAR|nr:uncharacterized protein BT62DRAFT_939214 [Guyanagaster necrorhizus MCA 3950]XP_043033796.1 uncharacterized protein BT62DRAFT_938096 [Guyanagaster necrorhizus MCA 3950]KAG7439189.1 hypothetical protein BT62DRAFT_939214 [Guyanagaster necrorhizus MCA 3950]KAG7440296.1 hypothetical protein BT62DRAFT_938096 [Guyanagaster necrorhizus MCA 3950]
MASQFKLSFSQHPDIYVSVGCCELIFWYLVTIGSCLLCISRNTDVVLPSGFL